MFKKAGKTLLGLAVAASCMQAHAAETKKVDVLLVGGGIMSSTLAVWLHELEPSWSMEMVERLDGVAEESSNGWNNAGTGHSALAELNYRKTKTATSISPRPSKSTRPSRFPSVGRGRSARAC